MHSGPESSQLPVLPHGHSIYFKAASKCYVLTKRPLPHLECEEETAYVGKYEYKGVHVSKVRVVVCCDQFCDAVFSDHVPVLFEVHLTHTAVKSCTPAQSSRIFNSSTTVVFSAVFDHVYVPPDSCGLDELSSWFHSSCLTILDSVAPLRTRQLKSEPWLNDRTRAVRQECCRAKHRGGERTSCTCLFKP